MDEAKLPYGFPILFRTPLWFTLPSDDDVRVKLRPAKYKDVVQHGEILYAVGRNIDTKYLESSDEAIADSIVTVDNAIGFTNYLDFIKQLPIEDKKYLLDKYQSISLVNSDQLANIKSMLEILYAKPLQDENWSCDACKHKKLQGFRACGFIPEKERSKDFIYKLKGKIYTECPKNKLEPFIMSQSQEAYRLFNAGILPENGGIGEQTMWFVEVAALVASQVREMELESIK